MWWSRMLLPLLLSASVTSPLSAQEAVSWKRVQDKGIDFADLPIDKGGRLTLYCRETSMGMQGGIAFTAPTFVTRIIHEETYGLTMIVDGARDSLHMVARNIELWFEAEDLNQQTQLARLFDDFLKAQRLELGISTIAWRASANIANPEALAGLMDKCV